MWTEVTGVEARIKAGMPVQNSAGMLLSRENRFFKYG
jgi:hypothetical protein